MKLTYIITTRGRPDEIKRTLEDTIPSIRRGDTKILVCVDSDDIETIAVLKSFYLDSRVIISIKPREDSRGEKHDRALTEAPADIYMMGHDCASIRTPGFDQIIVDAAGLFPDGIGCVYTPMANAAFPSMQAITAKLVEKIGYTYSHEYPYWFIDHELDDIARMIGRYVCVNMDTEHHQTRRPSKTTRLRDLEFWTCYFDAATIYRRELARSIIDDMDEPEWRKTMLKTWNAPIESRSMYINACVRANAAAIEKDRGEDGPPDLGYLRIVGEAQKIINRRYHELKRLAA